MHSDLLGFLDCLLHVETLLLSGVSREDGELVELNEVLEGQPRLHAKAFVLLTVHTYPRVLALHFLHNRVPFHLRLADDITTEQLVCLEGLRYCSFWAALTSSLICGEHFPFLILLGLRLTFWSLEEQFQLLPNFNYS
jgi:hypothetical protein